MIETVRTVLRFALAAFFLFAGVGHFTQTAFFVEIVPAYLPAPEALVYLSGAAEMLGGAGVLIPGVRRYAGWGLLALLVAVFPANLDMALNPKPLQHAPAWMGQPSQLGLWLRLPFQAAFMVWVWWTTLAEPRTGIGAS
ncbi:MAG: DoxX family membrane protein [Candidatus Methylomirabilis sp.]|nr:DoxX family membrane protein [Deltaproteobacteria bacterium]